ncbi:winged helix-turn-helix transcriptional regulator [Cellulosimicrobium terreum]|nr:winged helix-turn-helix transcriptional regulator [Cellulosimicrobium terreum]
MERLDGRATWLVSRAQLRGRSILRAAFDAAGSRPHHYRILAALQEHGAASQADVGRLTDLDRSDVSVATDLLRGAGFVVRDPDPDDRRRNLVALTDAGRDELRRLDRVLDDVQEQFLAPLGDAERASLVTLLGRLTAER